MNSPPAKDHSQYMPGGRDAPYGSTPRGSKASIWLLGIVYAAWFGFLIWMAMEVTGQH